MTAPDKRPIAPISIEGVSPGAPATSPPSEMWVAPTELLVDASYQRDLSDRSQKLIRKIIAEWDWRRFKPPIVAMTDAGFECIDGQHTAIAAASHPAIEKILVVVVDATEQASRASAFIGHNRDRLAMTPTQLHNAAVVAGEAEAIVIQDVTQRAGIRILRAPPSGGAYKPRDTQAVAAVASLVRNRGERGARIVLDVLAKADLAPVSMNDIRAADHLMNDPEFAGWFLPEALTKTIADMGVTADQEAKVFAATHCVPRWRGLASVWFKNVKKLKERTQPVDAPEKASVSAAPEASPAAAESGGAVDEGNHLNAPQKQGLEAMRIVQGNHPAPALLQRRVIDRRPPAGAVPFGEPPPGRSALDQRRAEEAQAAGRKAR